jgi:hypothetical protein
VSWPATPRAPRGALAGSAWLAPAAAAAAAIVAGYALAVDVRYVLAPTAAGAGALAVLLGYSRPDLLLALAFALLVLIPFTSARYAGPLVLDPATLALCALALAMALRNVAMRVALRLTVIDVAAVGFLLCMLVPVVVGVRSPAEYGRQVLIWGGPYLAIRLATAHLRRRGVAPYLVIAALTVVPAVLFEWIAHRHLYSSRLVLPGEPASDAGLERLGVDRVVVSFGHPIPLAMFLATAAVLAVGLALAARGGARLAWLGVAAALALTQALALSRLGWVVLAGGLLLMAVQHPRLLVRPGIVASALAVVLAVTVSDALGPTRTLLFGGGSGSDAALSAKSADYRRALIAEALQPGTLRVVGNKEPIVGPRGNRSIDNAYIRVADRWGLIGLAGLSAVVLAVLLGAVRRRRDALGTCVYAATIANLVGLAGVAFATQQQIYVWMLLGASSALWGTGAARADG